MKISIHRALAELKLLEKRIERASMESFIGISVGDKAPKGYKSVEEFEKVAKAAYQSVTTLIARRNAIKGAIIKSNAETTVTIAGITYSVAEAIDQKNFIEHEEQLLKSMKRQFQAETDRVQKEANVLQKNLDQHLENLLGTKESKNANEEAEAIRKTFIARHETKLVDPLELRVKIQELEKKIEDFQNEIDYSLSESNASTLIEVPDTV